MSNYKLKIAIAGATGYVGLDLVNLLSKHPKIKLVNLCATKNLGKQIHIFDKRLKKTLPKISRLNQVKWNEIDLLFLSLPNGAAHNIIKKLYYKYSHLKFIDLSADFRIKNHLIYKKYYKKKHNAKNLINNSLYSIAELKKKIIMNYRIISNPGCYPTSIQLALYPLIKKKLIKFDNITIDSKSGYSGAGKNYKKKFKYKNFGSATFAYSPMSHRHIAEMDQEFKKISKKIKFIFNPHLVPTFRGILSSIYIHKKKGVTINKIVYALKKFYSKDNFIKILKQNTHLGTGNVLNTNNCEISVCNTRYENKLVIFSAIDNLVKGAAGQAVQNMNLMFKFKETLGLK